MPISYRKLWILLDQRGIKKVDLRKTLNPKTVNSLIKDRSVTMDTIATLCELLGCQPGDIVEYDPNTVESQPKGSVGQQ